MTKRVLIFAPTDVGSGDTGRLLQRSGYTVECADWRGNTRHLMETFAPDLLVVTPSEIADPADQCREIRKSSVLPLMVVVHNHDLVEELRVLAAGADDYIALDRSNRAVVARSERLVFRRSLAIPATSRLRIGKLEVDRETREVLWQGDPMIFTRTEFEIISYLTANNHRVVPRRELLAAVWGTWYGGEHVLEVHLSRLRKKLAPLPGGPEIETIRAIGYRINPPKVN